MAGLLAGQDPPLGSHCANDGTGRRVLRDFWHRHPEAEQSLRNWHTVAENSRFAHFADLRQSFGSADYVPPYTVFDVRGSNYRVVVIVRYRDGKITDEEYDRTLSLMNYLLDMVSK